MLLPVMCESWCVPPFILARTTCHAESWRWITVQYMRCWLLHVVRKEEESAEPHYKIHHPISQVPIQCLIQRLPPIWRYLLKLA